MAMIQSNLLVVSENAGPLMMDFQGATRARCVGLMGDGGGQGDTCFPWCTTACSENWWCRIVRDRLGDESETLNRHRRDLRRPAPNRMLHEGSLDDDSEEKDISPGLFRRNLEAELIMKLDYHRHP